jgi:hypothetical protein
VARSKQQQAHPPSPAAKPQLSLSLRWMLQISGYFYKACSWTELNTCIINTTWCPPDQNLCVGLATRVLYRCSARVLVNNAISGFASMELLSIFVKFSCLCKDMVRLDSSQGLWNTIKSQACLLCNS